MCGWQDQVGSGGQRNANYGSAQCPLLTWSSSSGVRGCSSHLKLRKFYPIQKLGIEIDATGIDDEVCKRTLAEFCAHEGIPVPDDQGELEDLFESEEMEMFAMFNDSNYVLEAYDALLKPHGLRLIDIGYTENAFLLMVKDDDEAVGNVEQALIDLGYVDIED